MDVPTLMVDGKPVAFVDKTIAAKYLNSPTYVERMLWATRHTEDKWFKLVGTRNNSRRAKVLITSESLMVAARRLMNGEEPPDIQPIGLHFLASMEKLELNIFTLLQKWRGGDVPSYFRINKGESPKPERTPDEKGWADILEKVGTIRKQMADMEKEYEFLSQPQVPFKLQGVSRDG